MSIATDLWFRSLRQNKPSGTQKPQRLDEISGRAALETFEFMADNGPRIQTEFDDIFDGALRKVIPLASGDDQKLAEVIKVLKDEGWHPPADPNFDGTVQVFPTKVVKEKKRRLADQGGGTYYEDVVVASFELVKEFDYEIPAGPRKGETVRKKNKTTMSRAIANAVKFKRLRPELLEWWRTKQTLFAKDEDTYKKMQEMFYGTVKDDQFSIILSRHPVDVLRMSDLPGMSSCHSEGGSHFQCAVAESKGNGLIAYMVNTSELNSFLRIAPEDTAAQLQHTARKTLWRYLAHGRRVDTAHKYLNDSEQLEMLAGLIRAEISQWNNGWRANGADYGEQMTSLITPDMVRDAVHAKLDDKLSPWPDEDDSLPAPAPIADFDRQEIFRDPQRNIEGIAATTRLRLRKFFDSASGDWFTVPEARLYGRGNARFRTAVREWAWESQKYKFVDGDHMELPRKDYLIRYGGSYEDTTDGTLLNNFFSMSGQEVTEYGHGNVQHDTEDEDGNAFDLAEEELEEVLNSAQNRAEHVHFHAEVTAGDEEPYVYGGADVEFSFDIEWEGAVDPNNEEGYVWPDEEREHTPIPKPWGDDWGKFTQLLDDALGEHSNETEWDVSSDTIDVRFRFDFDNGSTPEEYDGFVDNLIDEIDDEYDEKFQTIRRALVLGGYLPPNDFDRLADDIVEQSKELVNWEVLGIDEDDQVDADGEVWFLFKPQDLGPSPSQLIYLPRRFPAIIGNTKEALRTVFGDGYATIEKRMVRPGVRFMNVLSQNSQPLVNAANGYVEQQLEFEFGDRYNRPSYEPIDFGHGQIRFDIDSKNDVYFTMKLVVEAASDEADIKGAFEFMRFIDKYPNQVIKVVTDTYEQFVDLKVKALKERERRKLDGTDMRHLSQSLAAIHDPQADAGDQASEQVSLVIMFIQQNWDKFSRFEKLTAVDNYLRPLHIGSAGAYGIWDNDGDRPNQWDGIVRAKMRGAKVPGADRYTWGEKFRATPSVTAQLQNRMGMSPEESREADSALQGLSDEQHSKAMDAFVRGDKEEFVRIVHAGSTRGPIVTNARGRRIIESLEEQIDRIDQMLNEREPIDLRIYKVKLGCVVNTIQSGRDEQIENQIRGIPEVTTVRNIADLERKVGADAIYRVYEVKFELFGQQARDTYRDSVLVPSIEKDVRGVTVRDRGLPELADAPLREWGGLGYAAPPYDHYLPTMPTPRVSLDSVLEDWAEGGVQIYDTPQNTNEMQYHVMMPASELWKLCSRYYRGSKTDFDGRYTHFIKNGPQMPVYVALGQNGRARVTGGEDLIWFAKKSGLEELPVFFSYQKQV